LATVRVWPIELFLSLRVLAILEVVEHGQHA
jgi:hypothetical protein